MDGENITSSTDNSTSIDFSATPDVSSSTPDVSTSTDNTTVSNDVSTNTSGGLAPEMSQSTEPQYYSDTDFMAAITSGKFEQSKISPSQQQFLNNQQARYQLEMQERQQQIEAMRIREQQIMQEQAQSLAGVHAIAHEEALRALSLTPQDFENIDYLANSDDIRARYNQAYQVAYANAAYKIAEERVHAQQQQQAFQSGMNDVSSFVRSEQATEPHCNEILEMMNTAMDFMPHNQSKIIEQAWFNIQNGICGANELSILRKYYDYCKKQFYQKNANITTVPQRTAVPKVEHTGQPKPQSAQQPMDWTKLKGASRYERDMAIRRFIQNNL